MSEKGPARIVVLSAGQVEDCVHDLRRLLDSEGLPDVQILVTSAKSGAGIEELRKLRALARNENYSMRGGPRATTTNSADDAPQVFSASLMTCQTRQTA